MNYKFKQCIPRKYGTKIDCCGAELVLHHEKCEKFFGEIEKGESIYINVERIVSEDENSRQFIEELSLNNIQDVRVSLLTEKIIDYDLEMFSREDRTELVNKYRPYFTSFIVSLEDNSIQDIESLGVGWYEGRFLRQEEGVFEEGILLDGILETSASPVNYLKGKLLVFTNRAIKKSVLNKINSMYDPRKFGYTSSSDVENILNDAWVSDFPYKIDIYNVGHGNADYIRGSKHRILYDIGYNYRSFPRRHNSKYLRAVNAFRHLQPSCVVLSHWDMDHIIGCAYASQDIFNVKWIAPYLVSSKDKKASINSIRLAHYLNALGNLCLVDREQTNKLIAKISCANDIEIKVWLGSGTSNKITPRNREGLTLEILDKKRRYLHVLLAGDVPYKCMNNLLTDPIGIMHVPHHCSSMELDKLKNLPSVGKYAIISTNRKKTGTLNCDSNHHDKLRKKFKEVLHTIDNPSGDDEANLSIQIDYKKRTYQFR